MFRPDTARPLKLYGAGRFFVRIALLMRVYLYMQRIRSNSDMAGVILLALAVVAIYSAWGAHILAGAEVAPSVALEQKR